MFVRDFVETRKDTKIWPKGNPEECDVIKFKVSTDKGDVSVEIWYTMRDAFNKKRNRVLVFVDGYQEVQFNGTDDFETTGQLVSLIKKPNSQEHYHPGVDIPPVEYTPFNIVIYKDFVNKPKSFDSFAILVNVGDISTMIYHGLIQAKFAGRL